jgi:hypothetical protein
MEAMKDMIHDQDLPMHLDDLRSIYTYSYVDKSPHKVLENKTPDEIFSGEKPEVNHLRIFGCPIFVHVPKENRTKLDPSRKNGICFGYNDTSKAYMIYIIDHQKVDIIHDVTFDESENFSKSK